MTELLEHESLTQKIHEGVKRELRRSSAGWDPGNGSLGCAFFFLVGVSFLVGVFTLIQYEPSSEENWLSQSEEKMSNVNDIFLHLKDPETSIDFIVTEEEATDIVKNTLAGYISDGEVRLYEDGIQGRFLFEQPFPILLKIVIFPEYQEKIFDFQIREVSVGKLPLPSDIFEAFVKYIFRDTLTTWNDFIEQNLEIGTVELSQGKIILKNVSLPYVIY